MADTETLHMYSLIREARAHLQNVQASIAEIRRAAVLDEPVSREAALTAALEEAERTIPASQAAIAERFSEVRQIFDDHPVIANFFRDFSVYAQNAWRRALAAWPSSGIAVADLQPKMNHVDQYLKEAVYWCGYISIPSRLLETMSSLRTGEPLDFHWAFLEELPVKEDRDRILLEISRQPRFLSNGVADTNKGLVYCIAEQPWKRAMSVVRIGALAMLGFVIAIVWCNIGQWFGLNAWLGKPEEGTAMFVAYLFLLLGSGAHVLVNALKEHRAQSAPGSFVALDDWIVWAHIREHSLRWSMVYLWCGLIMLAWTHSLDWRTAFFAGYSIDSITDLFLQRFEKIGAAGAAAAKVKLAS